MPNFITEADPYSALHRFSAEKGLGFFKVETTDGVLPFPPSTPDKQVAPLPRSGRAIKTQSSIPDYRGTSPIRKIHPPRITICP